MNSTNKMRLATILKKYLRLKNEKGVVLLITLIFMIAIGVLGIGAIVNSSLNSSIVKNYIGKMQSFYAADAQVTLLAQECFDGNADKYFGASASCGSGGNIIQNCDFSSNSIWYSISQNVGACGWACGGCSFNTTTLNGKTVGHLSVTNGGDDIYSAELCQDNLTIKQDTTYRVSFDISTPESLDFADVNIQSMDSPWPLFTGNRFFYPSGSMKTISYDFKMDSATTTRASLDFQCGSQGPLDLYVDNVSVKPISNTNYNLALGATAYASGTESGHSPADAIDGNARTTRWGSPYPGGSPSVTAAVADAEWLAIDLGQICIVSEVLIKWEAAFAQQYEIDVSTDNSTWYQVAQISDGAQESRSITFSPQDIRYIRMKGIQRGTSWGYSIYEFEVYGGKGGRTSNGKALIGGDSLSWQLSEIIPSAGFSISDSAFSKFGGTKRTFNTHLSQYVEIPTGGLVNPYGAIAKVPVTYYDYHSDRSNPEFEQPNCGGAGVTTGMVQNLLDGQRKPVLLSNLELNKYIGSWFKAWAPGVHTYPRYQYNWSLRSGQYDGNEFTRCPNTPLNPDGSTGAANDTSFINIVIQDSLSLTHIGNGMYQYINDNFFPLDGRGFGNEWNEKGSNHNFSFTMEIKSTFTKMPGQVFYFSGDDDVWVFINNKLVMDLGGIHLKATQSLNVDTIGGLITGNTYNFDFFYCERHSDNAELELMTNLLTYHQFTSKRVQWKRDYGKID